jgi:hypothetical protein
VCAARREDCKMSSTAVHPPVYLLVYRRRALRTVQCARSKRAHPRPRTRRGRVRSEAIRRRASRARRNSTRRARDVALLRPRRSCAHRLQIRRWGLGAFRLRPRLRTVSTSRARP